MYHLQQFDIKDFLSRYWQKKPCVIRGLFKDFTDPLDEHELAGLAQEDEIDSRIISCDDHRWQIHHGPFESFEDLCCGQWSLLVQGVDRYLPEAKQLLDAFDFIPHWRKDDLMVSFSVPGAGVGPHLDQYDVFIVQGKGKRRWQVGEIDTYSEVYPAPGLRQINGFTAQIDEILESGDVIYIPPGFPHNGTALEECLNFSVGFRAPSQAELLSDFADFCLQSEDFSLRYGDKDIVARNYPTTLNQAEIEQFRALMKQSLDSSHFPRWLGQFLSKTNHLDDQNEQVTDTYSEHEIQQMLSDGVCFAPALHLKPLILERDPDGGERVEFYLEGERFSYPEKHRENINLMLNSECWPQNSTISQKDSLFFAQLLTKLVNAGCWYPA